MKKKIAVLGGGTGGLAAAWALCGLPGAADNYEITVYQMGWRLGGKGASGRNADSGDRIQEHGLHVWGGFYENAFKVMDECYAAMPATAAAVAAQRAEGGAAREAPAWFKAGAFKQHSAVMLQEWIDNGWRSWPLTFPQDGGWPGRGGEVPSPWQYVKLVLEWIVHQIGDHDIEAPGPPSAVPLAAQMNTVLAQAPASEPLDAWAALTPGTSGTPPARAPLASPLRGYSTHDILHATLRFAGWLEEDVAEHFAVEHASLVNFLSEAHARISAGAGRLDLPDEVRRLYVICDLGLATARGMVADGVLFHGFTVINDIEWRAWLARHGGSPATVGSAFVRGIYDYIFGFRGGRSDAMEVEAGTATNGVMRLVLTFKGALFWEMQGGMGDIVFAPLFLALRGRGVKFAFFHKVERLHVAPPPPGAKVPSVESIELTLQAEVLDPDGVYAPLVDVKGMPCWPAEPLYAQLHDGAKLKASGINLESAWAEPVGVPVTLTRGTDFDDVVLGISLGAFKDVAQELRDASQAFHDMCANVATVQTASMQLWLDPDAAALGAPVPPRIVSAYAELLNTWADMSFLLPRESWPAQGGPSFLAYFCSEFPDAEVIPPFSDHGFPARELARYQEIAAQWLQQNVGHIWPQATVPGAPNALNLELLHGSGSGAERLAAQYFRVNIDPTERYVLSLPGTSKFRLHGRESGFDNVYLAGDWVRTSINAGCVESAVMAGMDAAAALSGIAIPIVGGLK